MNGFQRSCLATTERALAKFGLRATRHVAPPSAFTLCEPGSSDASCIQLSFEAAQHACDVFLYPTEVSIRAEGYVHVPVTEGASVEALDRALHELLEDCASGLGPSRALAKHDARPRASRARYTRTLDTLR